MPPPARPLARRLLGWALLADTIPLYPLYALLFDDTGLSGSQISALFAIWSAVGVFAEVPSGAVADRFSRRGCLAAAGILQAAGYLGWVLLPGFAGFAAGFVLWGPGGSLISGAQQALLYDGLAAVGAQDRYAQVSGAVTAVQLGAQVPAAVAGTVLSATGGYRLVGWVSVGVCLLAAAVAARLPEPARDGSGADGPELRYLATLRAGPRVAAARPGVPGALAAAALLGSFDAVEECFPLILAARGACPSPPSRWPTCRSCSRAWRAPRRPGRLDRLRPAALALVLGAAMLLLGAAGLVAQPAGIAAVAAFYGLYRAVLVVVDARLQDRIENRSRATGTSVAGLGVDVASFGLYAAWAVGEVPVVALLGLATALALPRLLHVRRG